jgi:hypothetical protein
VFNPYVLPEDDTRRFGKRCFQHIRSPSSRYRLDGHQVDIELTLITDSGVEFCLPDTEGLEGLIDVAQHWNLCVVPVRNGFPDMRDEDSTVGSAVIKRWFSKGYSAVYPPKMVEMTELDDSGWVEHLAGWGRC